MIGKLFSSISRLFRSRSVLIGLVGLGLFAGGMLIDHSPIPQFVETVWAAMIDGSGTISFIPQFVGAANPANTIGDSIMSQGVNGGGVATIGVAGNVQATGYVNGTYFADSNNPAFYDDPATFTNINSLAVNHGVSINAGGVGDGSSGFLDVVSYVQAPIFKDRDQTSFYLDPAGLSHLQNLQVEGNLGVTVNTFMNGDLQVNKDLRVFGTIVAGVKDFVIDHPTRPGYQLVHSTLEGPEIAVFYRGTAKLVNGRAIIILPDYFDALTRDGEATVLLTAKGGEPFLLSYNGFDERSFVVHGTKLDGEFDWEVKSVRADQPPLEIERKK